MDNDSNLPIKPIVIGASIGGVAGLLMLVAIWSEMVRTDTNKPQERVETASDLRADSPRTPEGAVVENVPPVRDEQTKSGALAAEEESPEVDSKEISKESVSLLDKVATQEEIQTIRGNLKQIHLAFMNYSDRTRTLPPPRPRRNRRAPEQNTDQRVGLSWRVFLLPLLDQQPLFERFNLSEPWDSPHNLELVKFMPEVYFTEGDGEGETRYMVFSGDHTLFPEGRSLSLRHVRDGTSNTILLVHSGGAKPVTWTKPEDIPFDLTSPFQGIGLLNGRIEATLASGSTISIPGNVAPEILSALVTPHGNEIVDGMRLRREFAATANPIGDNQKATTPTNSPSVLADSQQRLKTLAYAMHNYESGRKNFPPAIWFQPIENLPGPNVSWRVMLLPYLEQNALFQHYDRNESWNGSANRLLLQHIPGYYQHLEDLGSESTRIQVFRGEGTPFGPIDQTRNPKKRPQGPSLRAIADGSSNTVMMVEAGPDVAVPWTQPKDIAFDVDSPLANIGKIDSRGIPVVMFDGSVRVLSSDIDRKVFKELVLSNDGK